MVGAATEGNKSGTSNQTNNQSDQNTQSETAQEKVETPQPVSITVIDGKGKRVTNAFTLKRGLSIFKVKHAGETFYSLELDDENGNIVSPNIMISGIGSFEGSEPLYIEKEGKYVLYTTDNWYKDSQEKGNWIIDIEQPRQSDAPATRSFQGSEGKTVTSLFSLSKGKVKFNMTHQVTGSPYFEVNLLETDSPIKTLLALHEGSYDGFKSEEVMDGIYILFVEAGGNWTITLE